MSFESGASGSSSFLYIHRIWIFSLRLALALVSVRTGHAIALFPLDNLQALLELCVDIAVGFHDCLGVFLKKSIHIINFAL